MTTKNNSHTLTDISHAVIPDEELRLLSLFSIIGILILISFGFVNLSVNRVPEGIQELIAAAAVAINLIIYLVLRRLKIALFILTAIFFVVISLLIFNGGIQQTGLIWVAAFPVTTYALYGRRTASLWNVGFILWVILLGLLQSAGYIETAYSTIVLRQLIASTLAITLLSYLRRRVAESNQDLIRQRNAALVRINHELEDKTQELQRVSALFEAAAKESESNNANLTRTQQAILNVMDDLNNEKAKDEAILSSIGDGVFAIDMDKRIVLFNPVAEEISGVSANDALGKPYDSVLRFISERTGQPNHEFVDVALGGKRTAMANHTALIRPDGSQVPVADSAAPIVDMTGKKLGAIVVFRDVTEEQQLTKAKEEFVSIASHELRTPATAVKNLIGLMKEGYAGKLTKEQAEYVDLAYDSNERQLEIINSLLYVARSDAGRMIMKKQPTDIVAMIESVVTEQKQTIEQRHQQVIKKLPKQPVILPLDRDYFRMAITNFISNASKYTPEKGTITLNLEQEHDILTLSFTDTGVGIAKEDLPKLFGRFSRIPNALSTRVGGNGLGLYLTKQIIDLHDGQVNVQSEPGKGTIFTVTLPLKEKTHVKNTSR